MLWESQMYNVKTTVHGVGTSYHETHDHDFHIAIHLYTWDCDHG